jgi:ATP-dependent helicase/nuclease subunit B
MALASDIDPNLQIDSFIRGLSIKKDGTFAKRTKRFTKEDLDNLKTHVEKTLETMLEGIASGDFEINPKQDQNRTPLSCTYCPFADICYKRAEDYETQSIDKNSDELFKALKEGA